MSLAGPGPEMASVEDRTLGGVPVRIYRPRGVASTKAPALVWIHGGGFTIGSIETDDSRVRTLADRAGVVVISVEYRLAPEHPFPAAFDDSYAAVLAVAASADELGIDASRIAVGGDSAGGNLTAAVALWVRDHGGPPIAFQLLVYPAVGGESDYPSMTENATGYFLTRDSMDWFTNNYRPPGTPVDERVEPMLATTLAGLPPAHVVTAEFDPLRDEGTAYANRLRADGVPTTHVNYDGCIHGFFGMEALFPVAKVAMDDAVDALRKGLGVSA
jgi:acetyl esterase